MKKNVIDKTDGAKKQGAVAKDKKQTKASGVSDAKKNAAARGARSIKKSGTAGTKAGAKKQTVKAGSKKPAEQDFGDTVRIPNLIKRTIMAAAFPALVRIETKEGVNQLSGFLPGFEFCSVEGIDNIGDCMQMLQDKLDDEVESLILKNEGLPFVPDDETLLKSFEGFEIKMLDINVWALPDDECGCGCCGHEDSDYCDCGGHDDDCECDHEEGHHSCGCGHCDCDEE